MARWILTTCLLLLGFSIAHGEVVTKSVPYTHGDQKLAGYLAYDDSVQGKRPGVLIVHEWWGLNDYVRKRAEEVAKLGYVAFAVDMYGNVTTHPDQAAEWMNRIRQDLPLWRERARRGLEMIKQEARVDPVRIAAIGYCFGGATVQQLAYSGADLLGIVSFHGPLIPPSDSAPQVKARVLIAHGSADPFVKAEDLGNYVTKMNQSNLDWRMVIYGGAQHSFTNPGANQAGVKGLAYDRKADLRSWEDMLGFFSEIFSR